MALPLFPEITDLPDGFVYHEEFVAPGEERALVEGLRALAFGEVRMRGQVARRRTAHFGWTYGYETLRIEPGPPLPPFLLPLREAAARLAGVRPEAMAEALLTHYPAGAGIGWHRDAPAFGVVVGISLLGACRLRFQRGHAGARESRALTLAPRSAYVLAGAARWQWQHTIPPTKEERFSITFRTLRG
ncbi:MAG TPA: alpha-ketoglutarate-dependent dioxygenase AlkB [Methylomirabilota bacterium]|jgi:alkylated DNA repair dioxygenase AlkB|nr:alpha-ketoglutarate-dependent dioxygenase AlkB [Methylomirabilota bacterium]